MQKNRFNILILIVILGGGLFSTCRQKDVLSGNSLINEFIAVNMDYWYYWRDKSQPNSNKSLDPETYFKSLLYPFDAQLRPDGDRFSAFLPNAQQTEAALSGESKTTGARLMLFNNSGNIAGVVMYVFPGSPAQRAGIRRGNIFPRITVDGQVVTTSNLSTLLATGTEYVYTLGRFENRTFINSERTIAVTAQALQEDPILLDTIYTRGSKRIGYMVYNRFYSRPNNSDQPIYDQRMARIFGQYKSAGINEFILDLRYNGGGFISTAHTLASFIARGVNERTVLARDEYNSKVMPDLRKRFGDNFGIAFFQNRPENIGSQLQRVYILTSSRTASASELVINALKPFMEVFLIGDVTVGKNVGSIVMKDDKNRFEQGIMPIVLKTFNSAGQSDYTAGFQPNVSVREDISQPFFEFGDPRDPLLSEALFQITGSRNARRGISQTTDSDHLRIAPLPYETEMVLEKLPSIP
ncbi:MAG: S41 family peptidase [Runella sp.]